VLHPPPQSPDLNPIENLWDQLDRNIRKMPIRTIPELKQRLIEEWNCIMQEYLEKIISLICQSDYTKLLNKMVFQQSINIHYNIF